MLRLLAMSATLLVATGLAHADDKGTVVEIDGLKSTAPAAWKKQAVPEEFKSMRIYQFKIAKAESDKDDAELRVMRLKKGEGGDEKANMDRWKGEFKNPAADKVKTEKFKLGAVDVLMVDIEGTHLSKFPPFSPNAKITEKPEWRIITVQYSSPNGPVYFKMSGPAKTVAGQKKAFDDWVKAFK